MTAYTPAAWSDLFVAGAGAAAALTGLVFVAVSINIQRILQFEGLPERALTTLLLFLGVLVVSLLGLAPAQDSTAFGVELLVAGVLLCATILRLLIRSYPHGPEGSHLRSAVALALPGSMLYGVAGVSLLAGAAGGLYWVLAGFVGAVVGAGLNAWVLLVEILR